MRPYRRVRRLGEHLESALLHDLEQLERGSARTLGPGLPFLDRARAGVEVERDDRLADVETLAQPLDLLGGERIGDREASHVERVHVA